MASAICSKCGRVYYWTSKRGHKLENSPCPHCGGKGRRGSKAEMTKLENIRQGMPDAKVGEFYKVDDKGRTVYIEVEKPRAGDIGPAPHMIYAATRTPWRTSMYGQIETAGWIDKAKLQPFKDTKADRELLARLKKIQEDSIKQSQQMYEIMKSSKESTKAEPKQEVKLLAPPTPTPEAKEPWKMTKSELRELEPWQRTKAQFLELQRRDYNQSFSKTGSDRFAKLPKAEQQAIEANNLRHHQHFIEKALSEGKPVPAEVLKDYPELGKKEPERRTLGGGNVPDIGSADNPVVSAYGLPAYRKDGFWYNQGWSMTGSGKLDWHRVTDPQLQANTDALYKGPGDITKGHADAKAWLVEAKKKQASWGKPEPAKPEPKAEGKGKEEDKEHNGQASPSELKRAADWYKAQYRLGDKSQDIKDWRAFKIKELMNSKFNLGDKASANFNSTKIVEAIDHGIDPIGDWRSKIVGKRNGIVVYDDRPYGDQKKVSGYANQDFNFITLYGKPVKVAKGEPICVYQPSGGFGVIHAVPASGKHELHHFEKVIGSDDFDKLVTSKRPAKALAKAEAKAKTEPQKRRPLLGGPSPFKTAKPQSDRAIAIDRSLLAKQVVSVDDPRWLARPNRFDVRGIDTPGSGRITSRTGFTDKRQTRMSRKHHRGWKRIKL